MILWRWLRETAWPFCVAVVNRYIEDEGWVLSGYLAFSGLLALIPFLIFATALTLSRAELDRQFGRLG